MVSKFGERAAVYIDVQIYININSLFCLGADEPRSSFSRVGSREQGFQTVKRSFFSLDSAPPLRTKISVRLETYSKAVNYKGCTLVLVEP